MNIFANLWDKNIPSSKEVITRIEYVRSKYQQIDSLLKEPPKAPKGGSYVYVMHSPSTNLYKIGITDDPKERMTTIQRNGRHANPGFIVNLLNMWLMPTIKKARQIEFQLHEMYRHKNSHMEWFNLNHDDLVGVFSFLDSEYIFTVNSCRVIAQVQNKSFLHNITKDEPDMQQMTLGFAHDQT